MRDSDRMRALVAEIVTPRPQDIRAAIRQVEGFNAKFCAKIVEEFAEGSHDVAKAGATA